MSYCNCLCAKVCASRVCDAIFRDFRNSRASERFRPRVLTASHRLCMYVHKHPKKHQTTYTWTTYLERTVAYYLCCEQAMQLRTLTYLQGVCEPVRTERNAVISWTRPLAICGVGVICGRLRTYSRPGPVKVARDIAAKLQYGQHRAERSRDGIKGEPRRGSSGHRAAATRFARSPRQCAS